ncbi:hypothetical protein QBC43DRAFT_325508 [Cladorrhinum sp. PSN259]|nr:hypothetical protein QBC43DRAFT_325508 [Cladorrhinum sp. PSN259]
MTVSQWQTLVLDCDRSIQEILHSTRAPPDALFEFNNLHTRLKIWAGEVGIFGQGDASINSRLRADPDAAELLRSMLQRLAIIVNTSLEPRQNLREDDGVEQDEEVDLEEEGSTSSTSTMTLDSETEVVLVDGKLGPKRKFLGLDPISKANRVLDQMYHLSSLIYNPELEENAKVREFISIKVARNDTGEIEDVKEHAEGYLRRNCKNISARLHDRLISAAVFRRMKILYRRQKHDKSSGYTAETVGEKEDTPSVHTGSSDSGYHSAGSTISWLMTASSSRDGSLYAGSEAGTAPAYRPFDRRPSSSSTGPSKQINIPGTVAAPAPPPTTLSATIRRKGLSREIPLLSPQHDSCPYCFTQIRKEDRRRDLWTRHVLRDIDPYVCVFENCAEGDLLFQDSDDWLRHMQWSHSVVWQCPVPGHENEEFDSPTLLKEHLQSHFSPPEEYKQTNSQLNELVRRSKIPAADTFAVLTQESVAVTGRSTNNETVHQCPLCWTFQPTAKSKSAKEIRAHILRHLEEFAVRSLPQLGEIIEEEDEENEDEDNNGAWPSSPDNSSSISEDSMGHWDTRPVKLIEDRGASLYNKALRFGFTPGPPIQPILPETRPIVERLLSLRCRPKGPRGPSFYPKGAVEALIAPEMVAKEIRAGRGNLDRPLSDDDIQLYARSVCKENPRGRSYKQMFALLLLLHRSWEIVLFVDAKLCDSDLPLVAVPRDQDTGLFTLRNRKNLQSEIQCLKSWELIDHENFERDQWSMLAPWFTQGDDRANLYQLTDKDIMPWVYEKEAADFNSSVLSKVKIHPSHHNFGENPWSDGFFAVKRLKTDLYLSDEEPETLLSRYENPAKPKTAANLKELQQGFEREIETLSRLSGRHHRHDHLISLLAAYQRGDECCLIFWWADSNLKALLKSEIEPGFSLEQPALRWVIQQCKGIADGLRRVHSYRNTEEGGEIYGWHGAIKPEHILVCKNQGNPEDRGRLVLTDFGLTGFDKNTADTFIPEQKPTYRPPEFHMKHHAAMFRSFDIWSLGCVFLEYITWYLGGWTLLNAFVQRRKAPDVLIYGFKSDQFFELVREQGKTNDTILARVKTEVIKFIDDLHSHPSCSDIIHEFLDFIMDHMLVIESKNLQKRADCEKVHQELEKLYRRVVDPVFELVPSPRLSVTGSNIPEAVEIPLNSDDQRIIEERIDQLKQHTGRIRRLPGPASPRLDVRGSSQLTFLETVEGKS